MLGTITSLHSKRTDLSHAFGWIYVLYLCRKLFFRMFVLLDRTSEQYIDDWLVPHDYISTYFCIFYLVLFMYQSSVVVLTIFEHCVYSMSGIALYWLRIQTLLITNYI